ELRALAQERPGRDVWEDLCEQLQGWPDADHLRQVALPYVRAHLDTWPEHLRALTPAWREALLAGSLPDQILSIRSNAITHLDLQGCAVGNEGLSAIARRAADDQLTHLGMRNTVLGADSGAILFRHPAFGGLLSLDLSENVWMRACIDQLPRAPALRSLTSLKVGHGVAGDAFLNELSLSGSLRYLERLAMPWSDLSDRGLVALASSRVESLRALDLNQNPSITPDGLRALLDSPIARELSELRLCGISLGEEGAEAIASARFARALGALYLVGCEL
ncbi:unnamed protein product, partial [Laminaria digitata]